MECHAKGIRNTAEERKVFARAFSESVIEYLNFHARQQLVK
jgi:hypothetical protein